MCFSVQLLGFHINSITGQEVWSLEKCIMHAKENNLTIRQSVVGMDQAKITLKSSKAQRLPTLNYSSSGGYQWGRTIDYATNTFENQTTNFNSQSLQTGINLYNGGQISNTIKQANIDLMASTKDAQQTFENISLTSPPPATPRMRSNGPAIKIRDLPKFFQCPRKNSTSPDNN